MILLTNKIRIIILIFIFKLLSNVTIIATLLEESPEVFVVSYPLLMKVVPEGDRFRADFTYLIQFLKNQEKMNQSFIIKKDVLLYSGEVEDSLKNTYLDILLKRLIPEGVNIQ